MKLEIDANFEPDIAWLGEINRQTLKLEAMTSVFPASTTQLSCSLWRGTNSSSGVTLTLAVAGRELMAQAEDPSAVTATRAAFENLRRQVNGLLEECRHEGFWRRTSRNRFERQHSLKQETITTRSGAVAHPLHPRTIATLAQGRAYCFRESVMSWSLRKCNESVESGAKGF